MLVDAKDRFVERMAQTVNATHQSDTPSAIKDRWTGFEEADIKKAQAYAARARREAMRGK